MRYYWYYTACCCVQFFSSIWDRDVWFPFAVFHMCKHLHIRIFEAHNNITHKVVYIRISFYIVQSTSCFWQSFSHFLDYFISLPLVLKSAQLISASYPWFWTCFQQVSRLFHDFTTGSYQVQTYANILPLFSKQLHNLFPHFHWFAVCNRCSAYFSSLPWVFIYFFHL